MNKLSEIYYVSAPAGRGKTHNALRYIVKAVSYGEKFIFAAPDIKISEEIESKIDDMDPSVRVKIINSQTNPQHVLREFIESSSEHDEYDVLVITHKTLQLSTFNFPYKNNWNLIVDETIPVDFFYKFNIQLSKQLWIDHIYVEPDLETDEYLRIKPNPKNYDEAKQFALNPTRDTAVDAVHSLYETITDHHSEAWITREHYRRLVSGEDGTICIHRIVKPSMLDSFKSVSLLGANLKESMIFQLWSQLGVKFKKHPQIKVIDDNIKLTKDQKVSIKYISNKKWSKYHVQKIGGLPALVRAFRAKNLPQEYLLALNTYMDEDLWDLPGATKVSPICRGHNKYSGFTNLIYLASLNDYTAHFKFLERRFNIDPESLTRAKYHESIYQTAMRLAIRESGFKGDIEMIVPDLFAARYLAEKIDGATISHLDLGFKMLNRKAKTVTVAMSSTERQAKYREAKQELEQAQATLAARASAFSGSFELRVDSTEIVQEEFSGWEEFKQALADYHNKTTSKTKGKEMLLNGAVFDPNRGNTIKGLDSFLFSNFMVLDFDGGDLPPDQLGDILAPFTCWIVNSHSNGKDNLYHYHCYIPFKSPVAKDTYEHIWDIFANRIISAGYSVGKAEAGLKSGLDVSKRTPVSWFNVPQKAARNSKRKWMGSFQLDLPRTMLDPNVMINMKSPKAIEKREEPIVLPINVDLSLLDKHKDKVLREQTAIWQTIPSGQGNSGFFKFAFALARNGFDEDEIKSILNMNAHSRMSSEKRKRQISSIMKSLRRYNAYRIPDLA